MELFARAVRLLQGEDDEESVTLKAVANAFQGYFMAWLDLSDQGYELAKESVKILEQLCHPLALALAYESLGLNAYMLNRYTEEIEVADKMLEIATELDDKWLLAFALFAVSMGSLLKENYPQTKRLAKSNLKLYEEIGDVIGSTMPLIVMGHVALAQGEFEAARGFYLRCLEISQKVGFFYSTQTASKYLGKVAFSMRKITEA